MRSRTPIETAANGRQSDGRFALGNRAALGNTTPRKAARFRARLFNCITEADFEQLCRRLFKQALAGKPHAQRLMLQYLLGDPVAWDYEIRVQNIESKLGLS
jgi:hypothetical protein